MKRLLEQIFTRRQPCLAAVDLGTHRIKAVEVKINRGVPNLAALGSVPAPPAGPAPEAEAELAEALGRLMHTAGLTSRQVVISLPVQQVKTRLLKLPKLTKQAWQARINHEAQELVGLPAAHLTVRYVKLAEQVDNGQILSSLLLVALPTSVVEQYYHVFLMAGLRVVGIDLPAFSLWRLFGREADRQPLAVIDIGVAAAQLVLVQGGRINWVGQVAVGSDTVTGVIAQSYGISRQEARQLLEEGGRLPSGEGAASTAPAVQWQLDFYIREGIDQLAKEIYKHLAPEQTYPGRILLTGATSRLPGLGGYLSQKWGIATAAGPPACWQSVVDKPDRAYDPAYAVALGLILGEVGYHV
ncbi:pilus assembly protein PilM [Desulforamulus hydrothermalis]|uniref:Putative Type IV pilus assembly protein PilM n=1 Tax=Desulforamulus hydrothermalis Lam5 = DSM 18033 TaxID=1121428 RepID=K8E062_9FIRM|nr:pilus assembly protein PilM [Desulforamulus hydrothermalis]CCO08874.1 putative Type IV pilus assembly protein PilM [Desulforamulus hydrothermalis Lam5 = DSM 18033]SHG73738.1 type IV pilus assembly protein PilM [Desulforamulus hydrothermalis Lam5 = DSM 18033]